MVIIIVYNEEEVIKRLKEEITKQAQNALLNKNVFRIGLSGGSMLKYFCAALPDINVDLSKWQFFFCDERYVNESDKDSTFGAYKSNLITKNEIILNQFNCININLPLELCAKDYENKIRKEFNIQQHESTIPQFDLLLLGIGPDGHTCSLFPNHPLLLEKNQLIASISDSPKPPRKRITMTLPLINNARCCIFAMCGCEKAEIAKRIFVSKESLPAGLVQPKNLICIFDKEAGKYIKTSTETAES